ncbi:sensor histidine kinase [Sulfuricurvum sp.]|uniref:sensor histidine kinase n=1 Tax=Sulfuricurvum sp. TaxID=2025608 RepID=UPI003C6254B4
MKRVETESFVKSFLLFFLSLGLLNTFLFVFEYRQKKHDLGEKVLTQMKLCSFDLKCTQFDIDFVPLKTQNLYKLFQDDAGLHSFFSIPGSENYSMKLTLPQKHYRTMVGEIQEELIRYYLIVLLCIGAVSALFSWYALYPLKRALHLTEEFSKDILHDFNTPLASLRLNIRMLKCPPSEQKKVQRIEQSIETILALQDNLRSYLEEHQLQKEPFNAYAVIQERLSLMQKIYPDIRFSVKGKALMLRTNKDAFIRILDNLLSNAAKYNHTNGTVTVSLDPADTLLRIEDTGKGIANPKRAFERFYKEQDRGIGIGLHIVKKLCDTMEIPISLESAPGKGSTFTLNLRKLIDR